MKFFSEAFKATPNGKRNISSTFITMYMNFPDAAPSRAIIRTFAKEEYNQFSERKLMKIRKDVRGSIEGDIPALHLEKDNKIYLKMIKVTILKTNLTTEMMSMINKVLFL